MLGSAADVEDIVRAHGHDHADYVLSGLPFSTLPDGVGPAIAAATHRVLRPGGAFLVYQFSAKARDFMARHFRRIDQGFELLNVLPVRLFWGWKDAEPGLPSRKLRQSPRTKSRPVAGGSSPAGQSHRA